VAELELVERIVASLQNDLNSSTLPDRPLLMIEAQHPISSIENVQAGAELGAWIWIDIRLGGRSVGMIGIDRAGDVNDEEDSAYRLAKAADELQDHVVEAIGEAWPKCPNHQHPMQAKIVSADAVWMCPARETPIALIGALDESGA
jgi:hypothetical protein